MNTMFEAFKPVLQSAGVTAQATLEATYKHIGAQAKAQLRRDDIKPKTAAKWHTLGFMAKGCKN
ncbi:MAG: hypothetical protein Q7R67_02145 [bacterium]|nr:hypothetical protein [bacterium]